MTDQVQDERRDKKLACPGCENIFYSKNSLETHLINDHKMNGNEIETLVDSLLEQADQQQQLYKAAVKPKAKSRIYIKNVKILQKPNLYGGGCSDIMFSSGGDNTGNGSARNDEGVDDNGAVRIDGGVDDGNSKGFLNNESHRLKEPMLISRHNHMESDASLIISSPCSASPSLQPLPTSSSLPPISTTTVSPPNKTNKIYIKNVDILKNPIYLNPEINMSAPVQLSLETDVVVSSGGGGGRDLLTYEFNHLMRQYSSDPGTGYNPTTTVDCDDDATDLTEDIFMKNNAAAPPTSSNGIHLRTVDQRNLLNLNFINPTPHPTISSTSSSPLLPISSSNHQLNDEIIIMDSLYNLESNVTNYAHNDIPPVRPGNDEYNPDHYNNSNNGYGLEFSFSSQQPEILSHLSDELNHHHHHHQHRLDEVDVAVLSQHMAGSVQQLMTDGEEHKLLKTSDEMDDQICYYNDDVGDSGVGCGGDVLNNEDDILFVCAEEIINETNINCGGHHHLHRYMPANESITNPVLISENTYGGNETDYVAEVATGSGQPTVETVFERGSSPKRPGRGRPKGGKVFVVANQKNIELIEHKCSHQSCVLRFRSPDKLVYHERCHHPVNHLQIVCPECGLDDYRNWNTLHTHLWRQHQIDMELFSCTMCNFKTPILSRLNNTHVKIHSNERNFKCPQCDKSFKNTKQLKNHRRLHRIQQTTMEEGSTTVTVYKCEKCPITFTKAITLKLHRDQHHKGIIAGERAAVEFKCVTCGRVSNSKSGHKIHVLKHNEEKKFKCDGEGCGYATNDHNSFRRHKMKHNEDKHYKCPYCKYTSIQSTTFRVSYYWPMPFFSSPFVNLFNFLLYHTLQNHILKNHSSKAAELVFQCELCPFVTINKIKFDLHTAKHEIEISSPGTAASSSTSEALLSIGNTAVFQPVEMLEEPISSCSEDNNLLDSTILEDSDEHDNIGYQLHQHHSSNNILQLESHPVIRPAFFANNFSNVENLRNIDLSGNHDDNDDIECVNSSPIPQLQTTVENHDDCYNIDLT